MMYPLVRELAAKDAPVRVPVTVTCRVLKIARAPYYRWLQEPVTAADRARAYRANALFDAHRDDPEFGYRFLVDEARDDGEPMSDRTAWRICSEQGWWSAFGKKRARNGKKPGPPVHDDRCAVVDKRGVTRHVFAAEAPNQLWLADITEHWTDEGKLYECAIKDVWSNRIVGYSISDRMKSRIAVDALNMAVARRGKVAGCIVHSDRGSPNFAPEHSWPRSATTSSVARWARSPRPATTPPWKSFFALLQKNVLDKHHWATRHELRLAIIT